MTSVPVLDQRGSSFSPASLSPTAWYDPSDLSSMWQDSAGTTPAAVNSPVGRINDKSGNGNHLTQATTAAKPMLRSGSGLYWLEFDGVDDSLAKGSAPTLSSPASSLFAVFNNIPDTSFILDGGSGGDQFWGCLVSGGAGPTADNAGAPNVSGFKINGAAVANDRGTAYTALGTSAPGVVEYGSTNHSGRLDIRLSGYGGFPFGGRFYGEFCSAALSAADLSAIRTWLGAKAGITL